MDSIIIGRFIDILFWKHRYLWHMFIFSRKKNERFISCIYFEWYLRSIIKSKQLSTTNGNHTLKLKYGNIIEFLTLNLFLLHEMHGQIENGCHEKYYPLFAKVNRFAVTCRQRRSLEYELLPVGGIACWEIKQI